MPSLIAILGLNASSFSANLNRATAQANVAGQKISSGLSHHVTGALAGVASVAFIEEVSRRTIEWGANLVDTARKLGISVEAVQKFDYALKQNGSSIDALGPFFMKLGIARNQALRGNADAIRSFKELGVSIDDLKNKRLEDLALQIGDVFKAGGDPQRLFEALRGVGGRGAGDFIAAMTQGLKEAADEAERLGIILDTVTAMKLKEADDRMSILGMRMRKDFAPAIAVAAQWVEGVMKGLSDTGQLLFDLAAFGPKQAIIFSKERDEQDAEDDKNLQQKTRRAGGAGNVENEEDKKAAISKAERIRKLQEEVHRIAEENDLKGMRNEEKLQELIKRRAALLREIDKTPDTEERLKKFAEVGKIEGVMQELQKLHARTAPHVELNSLQRIGAYARVPPGFEELKSEVRKIPPLLGRVVTNTAPKPERATGTRY